MKHVVATLIGEPQKHRKPHESYSIVWQMREEGATVVVVAIYRLYTDSPGTLWLRYSYETKYPCPYDVSYGVSLSVAKLTGLIAGDQLEGIPGIGALSFIELRTDETARASINQFVEDFGRCLAEKLAEVK